MYASLNHNIYIRSIDVDHAADACCCIVRPQCLLCESWRPIYFNLYVNIIILFLVIRFFEGT